MSKSLKFTLKQILQQYGVALLVCAIIGIINVITSNGFMDVRDGDSFFNSIVMVNGTPVNSAIIIFLLVTTFSFTIYSAFVAPWVNGFTGPYDRFETHIRLGSTRKSYVVSEIVVDILNIIIIQIMLLIIYRFFGIIIGQEASDMQWLEALKEGMLNYKVVLSYLCFALTARWLGALTYRFGGKLWLTILVISVILNILVINLFRFDLNITWTQVQISAWIYIVASIAVSILSILKQDVRGNK